MPEPAFLVDGVMEQRIIAHLCPNKPVRRIDCNGRDVALEAIVERVDLHIHNLNNKYHPIIILIDRETRDMSSDQIALYISGRLDERGHRDQYVVGVVDRCIENWILADWHTVARKQSFPAKRVPGICEGIQGKTALKKLLPDHILYNEPTWGKDFFLSCDPKNIYAKSASFRSFVDQLNCPCNWLTSISERFRPGYRAVAADNATDLGSAEPI
jgi:hypothetical protein